VNLSKCGASLPVGHHAAWYTVGPPGQRATLGVPRTGIFWIERISPIAPPHAGHRWAFVLVVVAVVLLALLAQTRSS